MYSIKVAPHTADRVQELLEELGVEHKIYRMRELVYGDPDYVEIKVPMYEALTLQKVVTQAGNEHLHLGKHP